MADESSGTGKLVPGRNGGKIWRGAPKNPVPGPGRPPSKIRASLRGDFDERREVLKDIVDGVVPLFRERCPECGYEPPERTVAEKRKLVVRPSERAKAMDIMARYGLGVAQQGLDEGLLRALASDVQAELGPNQEGLLARIHRRWVRTLGSHLSGE